MLTVIWDISRAVKSGVNPFDFLTVICYHDTSHVYLWRRICGSALWRYAIMKFTLVCVSGIIKWHAA
jgi:hypothetical protein